MKDTKDNPPSWLASCRWALVAVVCFQVAYSVPVPGAGFAILGYALALVRLTRQTSVRRAFYFGLVTAFLCYAPQLWFFHRIFSAVAAVLWLVLAFWVGLFTATICASGRRWGAARAAWLIPVVWTGLEYFRSELNPLKFSWLNVGYALPAGGGGLTHHLGMYGAGLLVFGLAATGLVVRGRTVAVGLGLALLAGVLCWRPAPARSTAETPLSLVGIQVEFPPEPLIPRMLDQALAKHPQAQIFVLSEYTLDHPVPPALKDWCRRHARYLVVGGEAPADNNNYYNTAFVVGTNGDIVFAQAKCVPIQFFRDGRPAPSQSVWNSPWGKIGFCVCYDLSYTRVTDELVRQGAQLLIVPTMDVDDWGRQQHLLHGRVAPVRAAEYGLPIFRLTSSGLSQAVAGDGRVVARAPMPGSGVLLTADLPLGGPGALPLDRWLAPVCTGLTGLVLVVLLATARP